MNKFITIGDEKVNITEIENAKNIPELLQTRVQYAILDQLNDMVTRSGMGNPDEVKKLVLRDIAFSRGGYASSFTFQMANQAVNLTEVDFTSEKSISELLVSRVQHAVSDQLNYLISQSENPESSLKKIKDSLILDITKIVDNYTPSKKNNDDN
jgi:ferredoxin-fold anticodon binding domain-containing protein